MPRETPDDDDDFDLPPLPPLGDDEAIGDALFEEAPLTPLGEDESVGLDDSTGVEGFDALDFLDIEPEESALGAPEFSDVAFDVLETDGALVSVDEYGWTEGNEPDAAALEDPTALVQELDELGDDYGGAEGVEDPLFDAEGLMSGLPALEMDALGEESTMDDLDIGGAADIELGHATYEQEARLMGGHLPPATPTKHEWMLRESTTALAVDGSGRLWAATGRGLLRLDDDGWTVCAGRGLESEDLVSLAFGEEVIFAGTRLGGLFRSADRGKSFEAVNSWHGTGASTVACHVAVDASGRAWLWAGGALYRSGDLGTRWVGPVLPNPVATVAVDGEDVVAICTSAEGWSLVHGRGGVRWESGPGGSELAPIAAASSAGLVAVAFEDDGSAPWLGRSEGEGERLDVMTGAAAMVLEGGDVYAAIHVAGGDRLVVIALRGDAACLLDLASEEAADPEGAHRVAAMLRWRGDTLVATEAGVVRIRE